MHLGMPMIGRDELPESSFEIDQVFDDLVCEISSKLEAGESIDLDAVAVAVSKSRRTACKNSSHASGNGRPWAVRLLNPRRTTRG